MLQGCESAGWKRTHFAALFVVFMFTAAAASSMEDASFSLTSTPSSEPQAEDGNDATLEPQQSGRAAAAELELKCSVCRHAIVPAVVRAAETSDVDAANVERHVEQALRQLSRTHAFDMISRTTALRNAALEEDPVVDEHIHEYVESALFDIHTSKALHALIYSYHHLPNRRHQFARLTEYMLCHCDGSHQIGRGDKQFSDYLTEHMTSRRLIDERMIEMHDDTL